jgi:endo-1,3-1,4-beta-glycanase ExoK
MSPRTGAVAAPAAALLIVAVLASGVAAVPSASAPRPATSSPSSTSFVAAAAARAATTLRRLAARLGLAAPTARNYASSFDSQFSGGVDNRKWNFANGWANGQPFQNGWSSDYHHVADGALNLDLKKDTYNDPGSASGQGAQYPYTAGETRSRDFYGAGCYSVCMKPSGVSGVSSSFYTHSGASDVPDGFFDRQPLHNEIDVEFVGVDTTRVQTNYFSRYFNPAANSGSGVERWHDLGFDAAQGYHVYGFKWTSGAIEWFADGNSIRTAAASETRIPSPDYSPMRICANIWPVNQQAEEWAGPLDTTVYSTKASYKWMRYDAGADCSVATGQCG